MGCASTKPASDGNRVKTIDGKVANAVLDIAFIDGQLGAGTSGATYPLSGLDGFRYAVKVVPLPDDDALIAASNEATLHALLGDHPACVRYCFSWIDSSHTPPRFSLLMEQCTGDLWSHFEAARPMRHERQRWSDQLSGAVQHIHACGVIHRDFSPWNVMVSIARGDGSLRDVKIGDFGLAARCTAGGTLRGMETEGAAPLDASALGSLYSAPELGSEAGYGQPVDAFSLGMVLFFLWAVATTAERSPDNMVDAVEALRKTAELPEPGLPDDCPHAKLISRLVAHEPTLRPTAAEAADAIVAADSRGGPMKASIVNRERDRSEEREIRARAAQGLR